MYRVLESDQTVRFYKGIEIIHDPTRGQRPGFYIYTELWDGRLYEYVTLNRTRINQLTVIPSNYDLLSRGVIISDQRGLKAAKAAIDVAYEGWHLPSIAKAIVDGGGYRPSLHIDSLAAGEESIGLAGANNPLSATGCRGIRVVSSPRLQGSDLILRVDTPYNFHAVAVYLGMTIQEMLILFNSTFGREMSFTGALYRASPLSDGLLLGVSPTEAKEDPLDRVLSAIKSVFEKVILDPEKCHKPDPPLEGRTRPGVTYLSYESSPKDIIGRVVEVLREGYHISLTGGSASIPKLLIWSEVKVKELGPF